MDECLSAPARTVIFGAPCSPCVSRSHALTNQSAPRDAGRVPPITQPKSCRTTSPSGPARQASPGHPPPRRARSDRPAGLQRILPPSRRRPCSVRPACSGWIQSISSPRQMLDPKLIDRRSGSHSRQGPSSHFLRTTMAVSKRMKLRRVTHRVMARRAAQNKNNDHFCGHCTCVDHSVRDRLRRPDRTSLTPDAA